LKSFSVIFLGTFIFILYLCSYGGQRLADPQKGINIVGGKKVFVP
jgi:hypothetical protein